MIPADNLALRLTAAVVIGRNEGERLRRCLQSLQGQTRRIVYVDSGSTDGSLEVAAALGATTVLLDSRFPFTAARARNAGFEQLTRDATGLDDEQPYVQFLDGDCEVIPGWLRSSADFMNANPRAAAVCGRRRERHPEASVYNLICDFEWNTPIGQAKAFGGDVLMRAKALREAGGYRDDLIAGEEPELAVRLRQAGWTLWRLDCDMTWHDAAITRYSQWWRRSMRAGYAFAEGAAIHGARPERHWVKEWRRALVWGAVIPVVILSAAVLLGAWALIGFVVYPLQMLRQYLRLSGSVRIRMWRSGLLVMGKFAEALGGLKYLRYRWWGGSARLIEYK